MRKRKQQRRYFAVLLALAAVVLSAWGQLAIAARARATLPPHAPGEVLLQWRGAQGGGGGRPGVGPSGRELLTSLGARPAGRVEALGIERWRMSPSRLAEGLQALRAHPDVLWAEPNYLVTLADLDHTPLPDVRNWAFLWNFLSGIASEALTLPASLVPNDPYYTSYARSYLQRLQVEEAWAMTTGDPAVIVAIVDTGVDCRHEDLQGGCWVNQDEVPDNGVDDDGNGYVDDRHGWNFVTDTPNPGDVHYHGTHVAGVVGARVNNGKGIAGMAGQTTLMPLVIFQPQGVGTYYDLIRAILYAVDNGAHIINLSLGASTYSYGEALAVRYARDHGVLPVAAAGNNDSDRVFYPAAHPEVMGVGATDASDGLAGFTNHGSYVSVVAPGVAVLSTLPGNSYGALSGTSMATPHVSGLAALILARNPTLTPDEVQAIIEGQADDRVGPSDLDTPGWDPYYGHGRINATRSLTTTLPGNGSPSPPPSGPPLLPWTPPCQDLIANGDFEQGATGWTLENGARVTGDIAYDGTTAVQLPSETGAHLWTDVAIPATAVRGTFFMALRIETQDFGAGPEPGFPFDDWLEVSWRDETDTLILSMLQAGNTSDNLRHGLQWDEVLAILPLEDLALLKGRAVRLDVRTGSDGDRLTTTFTVDGVRFCVVTEPVREYVPFVVFTRDAGSP